MRTSEWARSRQEAKDFYDSYVKDLIIRPTHDEDHPLAIGEKSKWGKYF